MDVVSVVEGLRVVWDAVRGRVSRDPRAAGAMDRLADQPANVCRQAAVEDHLDETLRADPQFAAQLSELVRSAVRQDVSDVRVTDAGAVAIGGNVVIRGGTYAVGRALTVGDHASRRRNDS